MKVFKVELESLSEHSREIKGNTLFGAFCTVVNGDAEMMDEVTFSDFIQTKKNGALQDSKKAMIDRHNHGNNVVWSSKVSWQSGYFIVATTLDEKMFKEILNKMLELGVGADRNSGNGQFKLVEITDVTAEYQKMTGDKCYTLSDSIPEDGVEFVNKFKLVCYDGISMDNKVKPLMYMVKSGAELKGKTFGIIGRNVVSDGIWTQGKAIVLPCA